LGFQEWQYHNDANVFVTRGHTHYVSRPNSKNTKKTLGLTPNIICTLGAKFVTGKNNRLFIKKRLRIGKPLLRKRQCFSNLLPERSAPELPYMETKWASLMSYGLTTDLLADTLPMETSTQAIILNTQQVTQRMEDALEEEEVMYIDGCPRDWAALPRPDGRITIGLDGGYVHARERDNRKAGWFEVITGKSVTWDGEAKSFGFVHQYMVVIRYTTCNSISAPGQSMYSTDFTSPCG
jgi:hypothetical protein